MDPIEEVETNDLEILLEEDNQQEESNQEQEPEKEPEPSDDEDELNLEEEEDESESEKDEEEEKEEKKPKEDDKELDERIGSGMVGRPTHRQLLSKYPNLYKDFPGLKLTFFREKAYTEEFPTVDDAKEAKQTLERYQEIDAKISQGKPDDFLNMLREANPTSEREFILDFLPTLHRTNRQAFIAITKPILKGALKNMFLDAKRNGNENLVKSAENVHDWMFGEGEKVEEDVPLRPGRQANNQPDPEKERLARENQELINNQEARFRTEILTDASTRLSRLIDKSIPEDVSPYLRKSIIRDTITELGKVLSSDTSHNSEMSRLLKQARSMKFSGDSKDRLSTAYLSRAKSILPEIYKKVKSEALRGHKKGNTSVNRPTGNKPVGKSSKIAEDAISKVRSGKMSERDFLNS